MPRLGVRVPLSPPNHAPAGTISIIGVGRSERRSHPYIGENGGILAAIGHGASRGKHRHAAAPRRDTVRQGHVRIEFRGASACVVGACVVDGLPLWQRPGALLPSRPPRHDIVRAPYDSREPFSSTRLLDVPPPDPGCGRRCNLRAIQPLPDWQLRTDQAGYPTLRGRLVGEGLCGQGADAPRLLRNRSPGVSVALPADIEPMDRSGSDVVGLLVAFLLVLQRHDLPRCSDRKLRSNADIPWYGHLRAGRPLLPASGQDVRGFADGLACLRAALAIRGSLPGERDAARAGIHSPSDAWSSKTPCIHHNSQPLFVARRGGVTGWSAGPVFQFHQ